MSTYIAMLLLLCGPVPQPLRPDVAETLREAAKRNMPVWLLEERMAAWGPAALPTIEATVHEDTDVEQNSVWRKSFEAIRHSETVLILLRMLEEAIASTTPEEAKELAHPPGVWIAFRLQGVCRSIAAELSQKGMQDLRQSLRAPLTNGLVHPEPVYRAACAVTLAMLAMHDETPQAIAVLKAATKEELGLDYYLELLASFARQRVRATIPCIVAFIEREEEFFACYAVGYLGLMQTPEATDILLRMLKMQRGLPDDLSMLRCELIEALGETGDPRAREVLLAMAEEEEDPDREIAIEALGGFGGKEVEAFLLAGLDDQDWGVRHSAAEALGRLRTRDAVPRLLQSLKTKDALQIRPATVIPALGQIGDLAGLPALISMRFSDERYIRKAVSEALVRFPLEEIVPHLKRAYEQKDLAASEVAIVLEEHYEQQRTAQAAQPLVQVLLTREKRWENYSWQCLLPFLRDPATARCALPHIRALPDEEMVPTRHVLAQAPFPPDLKAELEEVLITRAERFARLKEVPKADRLPGTWQAVAWPRNIYGVGFALFYGSTVAFEELPLWVFEAPAAAEPEGDLEVTLQEPDKKRPHTSRYAWRLLPEGLQLSWGRGSRRVVYDARWDGKRVWLRRPDRDGESAIWILERHTAE